MITTRLHRLHGEQFKQGVDAVLNHDPVREAMKKYIRAPGWLRPSRGICALRIFDALKDQPLPPEYANNPELAHAPETTWQRIMADWMCVCSMRVSGMITNGRRELGIESHEGGKKRKPAQKIFIPKRKILIPKRTAP
jgi:hypothetical protein